MAQGNLAVLNHRVNGRALRLFRSASGGVVEYLGEFEVDAEHPYYLIDAPEIDGGTIRNVFVFRLRPVGEVKQDGARSPRTPQPRPTITQLPVEAEGIERTFTEPSREPQTAQQRETALIRAYSDYAIAQLGHEMVKQRIVPAWEATPLCIDLYDRTVQELIEAKGTATREGIHSAIGQLLDYARYVDAKRMTILVPSRPRTDLAKLCESLRIDLIWPNGSSWERLSEESSRDEGSSTSQRSPTPEEVGEWAGPSLP
ncbi:restriction endonuclease [Actinoallomurus iriomotensis]|nr:restriction endonuclease [Actinoallomurus iriomotensis]